MFRVKGRIALVILILGLGILGLVACDTSERTPVPPAPTVTLIPSTRVPTITPAPTLEVTSNTFNPSDLPTYTPVVDDFLPPSANTALDAVFAQQANAHLINLRRIRWRGGDDVLNCDIRYNVNLPTAQDGYRVVLQSGNQTYVYLTDDDGQAVLCDEEPLSIEGRPLIFDPTTQDFVDIARNDLVNRLDVDPTFVVWRDIVAITWSDNSLGCPVPNATYEFIEIDGYWMSFAADNVEYTYHSDGLTVKFCPPEQKDMPLPFASPTITPTPLPVTITPTIPPTSLVPDA